MNTCLIIAGEKSGEEHCMSFFKDLKKLSPQTIFWGVGGDALKREGVEIIYHLQGFSTWGISGVFGKIGFYYRALKKIKRMAVEKKCKTAILIDFQTFNLILAWMLKKKGINILYYVAPQAWAWKAWRADILKKVVHTLFTIIPFEKEWFTSRGVERVKSVTHPLAITYRNELDALENKNPDEIYRGFNKEINLLLLPGSRNFEVEELLPIFFESVIHLKKTNNVKIHLVKSTSVNPQLYTQFEKNIDYAYFDDKLVYAFGKSDLCLAASGTVTLATALFQLPTVICYKSSLLNEYIFRTMISYRGPIGLANIVHQEYVYPELIQDQVSSYNIIRHLEKWIHNKSFFYQTKRELSDTKDKILGEGLDVPKYMADILNEVKY